MKKQMKLIILILSIAIIFILNTTTVYGAMASVGYALINVIISMIMKYSPIILGIIFIIGAIIYYRKSKEDKMFKIVKLIIIFIILAVISIFACYFSDAVLEAGKYYTSRPKDFNFPINHINGD